METKSNTPITIPASAQSKPSNSKPFLIILAVIFVVLMCPCCLCSTIFGGIMAYRLTIISEYSNTSEWFQIYGHSYDGGYDDSYLDEAHDHFSIEPFEDNEVSQEYIDFLYVGFERNRASLLEDFEIEEAEFSKVTIILYSDGEAFNEEQNIVGDEIYLRGLTFEADLIYFLIDSDQDEAFWYEDIEYMATHELVHAMQLQKFGDSIYLTPSWYIEGVAEYEALLYSADETVSVYNDFMQDLENCDECGTLEDTDDMEYLVNSEIYDESNAGYIVAWAFTDYNIDRYGWDDVLVLNENVESEQDFRRNFLKMANEDPDSVFEAFLTEYK